MPEAEAPAVPEAEAEAPSPGTAQAQQAAAMARLSKPKNKPVREGTGTVDPKYKFDKPAPNIDFDEVDYDVAGYAGGIIPASKKMICMYSGLGCGGDRSSGGGKRTRRRPKGGKRKTRRAVKGGKRTARRHKKADKRRRTRRR